MPEAMSADLDPDLALVRKLHLELNGSGRRTRGPAPPPVKKVKRETSRHLDEALKESSSVSISGSGSGSGKALKREGTLKRLIKKQPNNSDSNQDTVAGDFLMPIIRLHLLQTTQVLCSIALPFLFAQNMQQRNCIRLAVFALLSVDSTLISLI